MSAQHRATEILQKSYQLCELIRHADKETLKIVADTTHLINEQDWPSRITRYLEEQFEHCKDTA